jgi:hypothetical protein
LLWTSALWGKGCSGTTLATASLKVPTDVAQPRLLQLYWDGTQYAWRDITTALNAGKIEGAIAADYLGVLGIANAASASLLPTISGKGIDPANGSYYVDLKFKNGGSGTAYSVTIDDLTFMTVTGSGTVTYNTTVDPALPRSVGNVAPETSVVVRLHLKSSTSFGGEGVNRFTITQTVKLQNAVGTTFTEIYTQVVIP